MSDWEKFVIETVKATWAAKKAAGDTVSVVNPVPIYDASNKP